MLADGKSFSIFINEREPSEGRKDVELNCSLVALEILFIELI